jgi:hypothetical protein
MQKNIRFAFAFIAFVTACTDPTVVQEFVTKSCGVDNPCERGAVCGEGGLCYTSAEVPVNARTSCPTQIDYIIKDSFGEEVFQEGTITRNLECCNTDVDCAASTYGRHCVQVDQNQSVDGITIVPTPNGFVGFCQPCNSATQLGCMENEECFSAFEQLVSEIERSSLYDIHSALITGIPSRPVDYCRIKDLCGDGQKNGVETDVDCGFNNPIIGPYPRFVCEACQNGKTCFEDSDCVSRWCRQGVCGACRDDDDCGPSATCLEGSCK